VNAVDTRPAPRLPPRWFIRSFWLAHRAAFRISRGRFGLRTATADTWGMLRLTTTGRRTGIERHAILGYLTDGSDLVVLATNGMADAAPAWWRNLEAHAIARVDLPDGSRPVRARVAEGSERARLWAMWSAYGGELDAHAATRREATPVIVLEPVDVS
jgi:deazaflavin-dependent oxidoreductase (nitroreductase family)